MKRLLLPLLLSVLFSCQESEPDVRIRKEANLRLVAYCGDCEISYEFGGSEGDVIVKRDSIDLNFIVQYTNRITYILYNYSDSAFSHLYAGDSLIDEFSMKEYDPSNDRHMAFTYFLW